MSLTLNKRRWRGYISINSNYMFAWLVRFPTFLLPIWFIVICLIITFYMKFNVYIFSRQYHHYPPFNANLRVPEFPTYRPSPVYPPAFALQYQHDQRRHHALQSHFSSCNVNIDVRTKYSHFNSDGSSNASTNSSPTQPPMVHTSRCSTPSDNANDKIDRTDTKSERMTPSPEPASTTSSSENGKYTHHIRLCKLWVEGHYLVLAGCVHEENRLILTIVLLQNTKTVSIFCFHFSRILVNLLL